MAPSMLRRTFTLREYARLLPTVELDESLVGPDRWRSAIPKTLRARSANGGVPKDDDVVDPYRQDDSVYNQMLQQLQPALGSILRIL
jgi:protein-tyrosine phosphatase